MKTWFLPKRKSGPRARPRNFVRITAITLLILGLGMAFASGVLRAPGPLRSLFHQGPRAVSVIVTEPEHLRSLIQRPAVRPGGGATIVNFWATWCGPCREELPAFAKLKKQSEDRGLRVFLVNVEADDHRREVEAFLNKAAHEGQVNLRTYVLAGDAPAFIKSLAPTWSDSLPVTLLFDADGKQIAFWVGKTSFEELQAKVTPLLAAVGSDTAVATSPKSPSISK